MRRALISGGAVIENRQVRPQISVVVDSTTQTSFRMIKKEEGDDTEGTVMKNAEPDEAFKQDVGDQLLLGYDGRINDFTFLKMDE